MTLTEFRGIYTWEDLQAAMRGFDYYEALDGDLYTTESELIGTGIFNAARYEWGCINDVLAAELDEIDPSADAWVVSPDFSYIRNLYEGEYDGIYNDFAEWMEINDLFDDEEDEEDEGTESELSNSFAESESDKEADKPFEESIPIETLLFEM